MKAARKVTALQSTIGDNNAQIIEGFNYHRCIGFFGFRTAAKPVKITPSNTGEINGESYRNYTVECSNGKHQPLSSWENGKKWCAAKDAQSNCVKKQIKAAKIACKAD